MRPQTRTLPSITIGRNLFASLLCLLLVLMTSQAVMAQSGRGGRKAGGSANTPATSTESEVASSSSSQKLEAARLSLLITDYAESAIVPATDSRIIRDSFMERLKEATGVALKVERDVKRKDALLRAKAEKESYVVWLRVGMERIETGRGPKDAPRLDDLVVNYVVFAPLTGEVKAEGRVYCGCLIQGDSGSANGTQPGRTGRVPLPKTSGPPTEQRLERTGREAASRVLAAFGILLPSPR